MDAKGVVHKLTRDEVRRRWAHRLQVGEELLTQWLRGLAYDIFVLEANYIIDCGLRGTAAIEAYKAATPRFVAELKEAWTKSLRCIGLSRKKLAERFPDLSEPYKRVATDFEHFVKAQDTSSAAVASMQSFGSAALFTDTAYPPPDIWREAEALINEALNAWGFKGTEPEVELWNRWLKQSNWHGQLQFLDASIKHCEAIANHLLGESRTEDAAVFARVAAGLRKLQEKSDARLRTLISQQADHEDPVAATSLPPDPPDAGSSHAAPRAPEPSSIQLGSGGRAAERAARRQAVVMPILEGVGQGAA